MIAALLVALALAQAPAPERPADAAAEPSRGAKRDGAATARDPDRVEPGGEPPRRDASAEDAAMLKDLDLLENLELLQKLELFDRAGDDDAGGGKR